MEVFENGVSASLCGRVKTKVFENGGSASLCGRAKTEVFENDYVTGIGMSQLKKQKECFLIRFRWCSVDGRKRYKNASVDEKLFIRFQESENGGFRKRISVDRALGKPKLADICRHSVHPEEFLRSALTLLSRQGIPVIKLRSFGSSF